jgi:hypothetical protein
MLLLYMVQEDLMQNVSSPVIAVEVLVDANLAGRILLDLLVKIPH